MINDQAGSSPQSEFSGFDFGIVIRLIGVGIILVGISVVYKVVTTAWELFENSDAIVVPLGEKIEENSNID